MEFKNEIKEKYIQKLVKAQESGDAECAHMDADDILCDLLEELGFSDVVNEFRKINKWYA